MKLLKTFGILLIVIALFGGAMFGLNFYTQPLIEANNAGAANERLNAVLPDGKAFEDITSTLADLPASIVSVNKETSGLGFVISCQGKTDYSAAPMVLDIGISADGKICGIKFFSYGDDASGNWNPKLDAANYPATYVGQDSTLADVGIVAGATYSSNGFKTAVSEAMSVLITNNMIAAGVKSDAQILEELIPTVAPGYNKLAEVTASGNIQKAMKAGNDVGFAYIMTEGDASFLVLVNAMGYGVVYNTEGADVTAAHAALVTEAKAHAAANQTSYASAVQTKFGRLMSGAADFAALELNTFNTVALAYTFTVEGTTYYGFYSRSVGFHQMDVYFVLDENGAIVKMDAAQFIFEEEYFNAFAGMDTAAYKNGFVGSTADTWNESTAVIATATMTSNAMKQSTKDIFDAFKSINEGGAQ